MRAVVVIGAAAALLLTGLEAHFVVLAALYLAPALVLLALLGADRYPGERILERARRPASDAVAQAHAAPPRLPRPARRTKPRGSELVAWSLAGRAPPACAAP